MSRKRWAYTMGGVPLSEPVEVSEDYRGGDERMPLFTDRHHEGMRAPDGTDIGSRGKRKAYMQREGVADASDYTQSLQRAQQQREEWRTGRAPVSRETIEQVGRAAYEAGRNRR